mmetsp:Transcript_41945/g.88058  ORF Transcript_41945/g.88058 Transcript_41945/m.88058 type:complete len:86 (+) Transcript_41945:107-364(+)
MVSILGMINLILLGHNQSPEAIVGKWHALRDRIYDAINSLQSSSHLSERRTSSLRKNKLLDVLRSSKSRGLVFNSSFNTDLTTAN